MIQIEIVLFMHIPFVVEGGKASDPAVSESVCRTAIQSRWLSEV